MQRVSRAAARMVVIGAALLALPAARAEAQVVQGCQPDQYLDRTAAGADRQITWDFSIVTDPERCLHRPMHDRRWTIRPVSGYH